MLSERGFEDERLRLFRWGQGSYQSGASASYQTQEMQLWATWLLYAVLVDLTDAVAEALEQPFAKVSLEMVYRGLYFFTQAYHRGEATDVVIYLAANAKLLGILKRPRKPARQQQPACVACVQGP